jgi:acetylornithine deacetylase/succinyl-diaminopimelate desuccinylase-like protein
MDKCYVSSPCVEIEGALAAKGLRKGPVDGRGMDDLKGRIAKSIDGYVGELKEFISFPTISAEGRAIPETADFVSKKLDSLGFRTQRLTLPDAPPLIIADLKGESGRTLVFYNHYDVQPVDPLNEWNVEPFGGEIKDGKIFGRGVADDKGDLTARIHAVETLLAKGGRLPISVKFVIEGEEEIGSPHLHEFVRRYGDRMKGDVCIWEGSDLAADGRPQFYLGAKGLLYVEMTLETASLDLHSMYAAVAPNPAWRLVWALDRFKDESGKVLIPGFYDDIMPPTSEELERTDRNAFDPGAYGRMLGAKELLRPSPGSTTARDTVFAPTCNIAGFVSGYGGPGSKTVLPRKVMVKVDLRLVPNQDPDKIFVAVRKYLDSLGCADVQLRSYSNELPGKTPLNTPSLAPLVEAAEEVYGMAPSVWPSMAATGPISLFINELKVPSVLTPSVSYLGSGYHAPNEHIMAADYPRAIEFFAKGIERLASLREG